MHNPEANPEQVKELLLKIESSLEQLLVGKAPAPIADRPDDPLLGRIVELINMLSGNFGEMADFARALSTGNLDIDPPGRRNYLSAPLKELHSQLSSFTWSAQQLARGRVVGRMDYIGELSDALNLLIDRISNTNEQGVDPGAVGASVDVPMDSQHYHWVLTAFNHLPQMVLVLDATRKLQFANLPASRYFAADFSLAGTSPEAVAGLPVLQQVLYAQSSEENTFPVYREVCDSATDTWYKVTTEQISFTPGNRVYLHSIEDISEWKRSETQLMKSATTDLLTGVYNRSLAISALEHALSAKKKTTSCVAFIDIDGLKSVNDNYGHNEGDYVIKTIAQMLAASVRESDTVSRFGGDEFIVVFQGCTIDVAEKILQRVHEKIERINQSRAKPYKLGFSHGVTQIDADSSTTIKDIIQLTDKKMYERKRAKR